MKRLLFFTLLLGLPAQTCTAAAASPDTRSRRELQKYAATDSLVTDFAARLCLTPVAPDPEADAAIADEFKRLADLHKIAGKDAVRAALRAPKPLTVVTDLGGSTGSSPEQSPGHSPAPTPLIACAIPVSPATAVTSQAGTGSTGRKKRNKHRKKAGTPDHAETPQEDYDQALIASTLDFVIELRNTIPFNTHRINNMKQMDLFEELIDGFCELSPQQQITILDSNITLANGSSYQAELVLNRLLIQASDYLSLKIPPRKFKIYAKELALRGNLAVASDDLSRDPVDALRPAFFIGNFATTAKILDQIAHDFNAWTDERQTTFLADKNRSKILDEMSTKFSMTFWDYINYAIATQPCPPRPTWFVPGNRHYKERSDWESAQECCSHD